MVFFFPPLNLNQALTCREGLIVLSSQLFMFVILLASTKTPNISSITECRKLKILARWQNSQIKLNSNNYQRFDAVSTALITSISFLLSTHHKPKQTLLSPTWHSGKNETKGVDERAGDGIRPVGVKKYVGLRCISLQSHGCGGIPHSVE